MPEDQIQARNQVQPVSDPNKEVALPTTSVGQPVENLVAPTHTEVAIPQPLQDIGIKQIPVAKLPDIERMQPSPPNFGSIGEMNLPVGIEDINAARALRQGNPQVGIAWEATEVVREEGKLAKAA